eukprot:TRINITY_DN17051_c0_g1_i1.p1 TRINITY_DN17051_c0_g1~~TRINITY_DN17051_c0_g1_i1.p1  ORF type:complete len:164 (-),score=32.72 TRINITY_DN17051_c0_g1_i1:299-757(-)
MNQFPLIQSHTVYPYKMPHFFQQLENELKSLISLAQEIPNSTYEQNIKILVDKFNYYKDIHFKIYPLMNDPSIQDLNKIIKFTDSLLKDQYIVFEKAYKGEEQAKVFLINQKNLLDEIKTTCSSAHKDLLVGVINNQQNLMSFFVKKIKIIC